jgi:hypothetical protein
MDKPEEETSDVLVTTPIQKVQIFIWDIYNIIRNLNILKQFFQIRFSKREENIKMLTKKTREVKYIENNSQLFI